ncbi:MAG TPA: multicopper oxidase domain-containing protein [Thermodesulfobacteriota bacterium]
MSTMKLLAAVVIASALGAGAYGAVGADRAPVVEYVDFGKTVTPTKPAFPARLEPASAAPIKAFRIPITHETIEIADGVTYDGWTFGGTVPGPVIRVREGDLVRITLVNESPMPHSIDFHSARIAPDLAYRTIMPGEQLEFEFTARDPGAYLVHCGTPPVLMHIMQGMYLAIIVDPKDGWGTEADHEFVLVQSEFYAKDGQPGGAKQPDVEAALDKDASYVVFNGKAFQYKTEPLAVGVGDRVRFFVVNAGPSFRSDFHIVGAVFDRVYPGGNPDQWIEKVQTYSIPAGGGAVFETVLAAGPSGEGHYPFVTHAFADAEKGAVGLIRVGSPKQVAGGGH